MRPDVSVGVHADAFERFADSRRERAVRLAFRLLGGDDAAAEDVTQNALLRAHRALASFRGESSLDTWFYRILLREVQRHRRWQAIWRFRSADPDPIPEPIDPRPEGDPALRRRIAGALEQLSRAQREAFVLVHLEGFTVQEAAALLGKAPGTLKSHLHRALDALRRDLSDLHSERSIPSDVERGPAP